MIKVRLGILILFSIFYIFYGCSNITNIDNPEIDHEQQSWYNVFIETPQDYTLITKEKYMDGATLIIKDEKGKILLSEPMKIKGRGNSTWGVAKKPYNLKLDKKSNVIDMPANKSWVLLANYFDPTQIRNDLVLFIGQSMSSLEYTPRFHYANVTINGDYRGVYMIGEKLNIGKDRVNVGNDGFLMEIDIKPNEDEVVFDIPHMENHVNIKEPDVVEGDENYTYIKNFMLSADEALFSDYFLDPNEGYQKYIDIYSFAEWYVINEIAKNCDSQLRTSCYMSLQRGGKLKMGPLWDYDLAFGNYPWISTSTIANYTAGFYTLKANWFTRLFEDPKFVSIVKERFSYYYQEREIFFKKIEDDYNYLLKRIYSDNKIWGSICDKNKTEKEFEREYRQHVDTLKNWIEARFEWMNNEYTNK